MHTPAPICLFVYNRPFHTMRTIEALKRNDLSSESELFIISDAAKNNETKESVSRVRSYIQEVDGFKNVNIVLRETNLGLANNIISGITEILNTHETVIVLEDDILTSSNFLRYMNEALNIYKNDLQVASIHGYVYPIENLPETFFIKGADCWGWATWNRAWSFFESDGNKILSEIKKRNIKKDINYNGSMDYLRMLKQQIHGSNQSWAIRWHLSAYLNDMLTLYPQKSYVKNIGLDSSGEHCSSTNAFDPFIMDSEHVELKKIKIEENKYSRKKFEAYFNETHERIIIKGFKKMRDKINEVVFSNSNRKAIRNIFLGITPPYIKYLFYNYYLHRKRWRGRYLTWESASTKTTGYNSEIIFNKVYDSLYKVKNGISVYERDGIIFDKIDYSWPLLTGIMIASAKSEGKIHVLDYGGSLGSTYFQNKKIFDLFKDVKWNIIEQNQFVKIGKEDFEDDRLKFYFSVEDCLKEQSIDTLVLSSVIQYIEEPYEFLNNLILKLNVNYIVIDRTPFTTRNEKIVIQTVPKKYYPASYPCHILNIDKIKNVLRDFGYSLLEEFDALDGINSDISFKGLIYYKNT